MKNPLSKKKKIESVGDDPTDTLPEGAPDADPKAKKAKKAKKSALSPSMRKTLLAVGAAAILAVSGVLMLVSYVRSAEETAVAVEAVPSTEVLLVDASIPSGTTLEDLASENYARFRVESVPISLVPSGALTSIEQLSNMGDVMTEVTLSAGETVLGNRFVPTEQFATRTVAVPIPEEHHQASFRIQPHRVLGGQIRAGDEVSISATFAGGDGFPRLAAIILTSVEVVNVQVEGNVPQAVDTTAEGYVAPSSTDLSAAPTGTYLVTVAVTAEELTKLHYTIDYGNILIAAATDEPEADLKAVATIQDILGDAGATIDPDTGEFEIQQFERQASDTLAFVDGEEDATQSPDDAFSGGEDEPKGDS